MMVTIGLVANVYNEINALPGWLETHLPYFNDVRILHAGPQGAYSNDGTIELLEKWRIPVEFCAIDEGFGVVRTRAFRMSPCDWVMLLDADERFHALQPVLDCMGESDPPDKVDWILQSYDHRGVNLPNWENVGKLGEKLRIERHGLQDQGKLLRDMIESNQFDAVTTVRRHWHDLKRTRPTQNWNQHPDWQMRCVRNVSSIMFDPSTRMHERLIGAGSVAYADRAFGPFFDHYHFHFKRMEPEQRRHDIAIYDRIHAGEQPPKSLEYVCGKDPLV